MRYHASRLTAHFLFYANRGGALIKKIAKEVTLTGTPIAVSIVDTINWAATWQTSVYFFAAIVGLLQVVRLIIKVSGCFGCWKEHGKCIKECSGFSK